LDEPTGISQILLKTDDPGDCSVRGLAEPANEKYGPSVHSLQPVSQLFLNRNDTAEETDFFFGPAGKEAVDFSPPFEFTSVDSGFCTTPQHLQNVVQKPENHRNESGGGQNCQPTRLSGDRARLCGTADKRWKL
jgi:hypothetical protein